MDSAYFAEIWPRLFALALRVAPSLPPVGRQPSDSVCSIAEAGLIDVTIDDPRDIGLAAAAARRGTLVAIRHAYHDRDRLSDRMRPARRRWGTANDLSTSVNVARVDGSPASVPEFRPWVGRVDAPGIGLNFHAHVAGSYLAVELRARIHLISADDCRMLVDDVLKLIDDPGAAHR